MTLHASKGLEFPVVFMIGMEENILPHSMAIGDGIKNNKEKEAIEEERRVCYVGFTRAGKRLFLSYCTHRQQRKGMHTWQIPVLPSRFLKETELLRS